MCTVPVARSLQAARTIAQYLLDAGYTGTQLRAWGLIKTPWNGSELRPLLRHRVPESSPLHLLIRLFFFGEELSFQSIAEVFPANILEDFRGCGLLAQQAGKAMATCMLVHSGNLLLACDSVRRVRTEPLSDLVLGVNAPTEILGRCALTVDPGAEVLDLGTGCGTLALHYSLAGANVTGTDVNERALQFAEFNAALNGIEKLATRLGDRFEPVQGRAFDLIVSNPPFFLTPSSKLLFTNNPFTLDSFVESLARQAPACLKEGGYFQMLCEWIGRGDQPWEDRIGTWFQGSGCDVLIMKAYEMSPIDYVAKRAVEAASLHGETTAAALTEQIEFFTEQGVTQIYGGLIVMRRSTQWPDGQSRSRNWFWSEQMDDAPSAPIGDRILERFGAQHLLAIGNERRLLEAKPKVARDVVLVQESTQESRGWKSRMIYMERRTGLVRRLGFDAEIAGIVASWDGSQTLDSSAEVYARRKNLQKRQVAGDFVELARRLGALGLIGFEG